MAKGNDGNFLQHSVELTAASHLAALSTDGSLHISITHGMAPFEQCGTVSPGQCTGNFDTALQKALLPPEVNESLLVRAYRKTNASREHYPNTGELLASLLSRERISGGIAEVNPEKHTSLCDAWSGTLVEPVNVSWRDAVRKGEPLAAPEDLAKPWLVSLDPMTFSVAGFENDDKLHEADMALLKEFIGAFVETGRPGVALIFVYAMRPPARPRFWDFAERIAEATGTDFHPCWIRHQGGNLNLVAQLCRNTVASLPEGISRGK